MSSGRPSGFTQQIADEICLRLGQGESLRSVCRDDEMPSQSMVFRWLAADTVFREQYVRAREDQAETVFDRMRDTAADETIDVNRARLMIDTDKWTLSKLKPKVYGDKVESTLQLGETFSKVVREIID